MGDGQTLIMMNRVRPLRYAALTSTLNLKDSDLHAVQVHGCAIQTSDTIDQEELKTISHTFACCCPVLSNSTVAH
jgi:hypothetical protein